MSISADDLRHLVNEERVHRSVYLDPSIFELEMDRIFGRAWVYVGHDSQVPAPGDFFCTWVGRQPVFMCRHADGEVRVFFNRCSHRGARLINPESGNARQLRCLYHGWTFDTAGALVALPMPDLYPAGFRIDDPAFSLHQLPQVESLHGFIFATLDPAAPDLRSHLGRSAEIIDEMVNRSPEGAVEIAGGSLRYIYKGNWKFQAENLADQYHVPFSHESSTRKGLQFQRRPGERGTRARVFAEDGTPYLQERGTWSYPNGANANGAMHFDGNWEGEVLSRYKRSMVAAYGEERALDYMRPKRHNGFFWPNFDLHMLAQMVRVIRPLSVDRTEITIYPVKLKGAPEEMHEDVVRLVTLSHSAMSLVQTDDVEAFERCQIGLQSQSGDWIQFVRGLDSDTDDNEMGARYGQITSEVGMRGQHRAWLDLMTGEPG